MRDRILLVVYDEYLYCRLCYKNKVDVIRVAHGTFQTISLHASISLR